MVITGRLLAGVRTPGCQTWKNVLDVAVMLRLGHAQVTEQELEPADDRLTTYTKRQRYLGHRLELTPADRISRRRHVQQWYRNGARDVAIQVGEGGSCTSLRDDLDETHIVRCVCAVLAAAIDRIASFGRGSRLSNRQRGLLAGRHGGLRSLGDGGESFAIAADSGHTPVVIAGTRTGELRGNVRHRCVDSDRRRLECHVRS